MTSDINNPLISHCLLFAMALKGMEPEKWPTRIAGASGALARFCVVLLFFTYLFVTKCVVCTLSELGTMRQLPPRCGDTLSFDRFSPDVLDLEEKRKSRWKETRKKVECSFRCGIGSNKKNVKKNVHNVYGFVYSHHCDYHATSFCWVCQPLCLCHFCCWLLYLYLSFLTSGTESTICH